MEENPPVFLEEYLKQHPADLADRLQRMETEDALEVLRILPAAQAALVVAELEEDRARDLLHGLSNEQLSELFGHLAPNQITDLAADLPLDRRREVLSRLPPEKSDPVANLLRYPEDSAGGIMNDRFIALRADQTIQQCHELLRERAERQTPEDVSYLYVTDQQDRLVGVVSLRDLVFRRPERRIDEIMNRAISYLRVDADQEEIAREFQQYHYLGLPVLEKDGRLVGIVRANDVINVIRAETTEDMQLMVGLSGEERALTPWQKSIGKRLPWLLVNLATAFLAAAVVGFFESTIAALPLLAVFLPIVAGQGGNAGMQTLTVIIRDMALGEMSPGDGRKALFKELMLGFLNGLAIGLVVGLAGYLWKGNFMLGVVVCLAMLLNMIAAAMAGVMIPYGLKAVKIDPALASSIFVTTVTDVAGFFFFLGLAAILLRLHVSG